MRERAAVAIHTSLSNISPGKHITAGPFNVDTIATTLLAVVVVCGLGLWVASRASADKPSKVQIVWELISGYIADLTNSNVDEGYRKVVEPLALSIFVLVLCADWVEILPGLFHNDDYLPSPTGDVNLCYALAIVVFAGTTWAAFKARGFGGYFSRFVATPGFMAPIRLIEEVANPISLALRLFGNLFAGGIMIQLLIAFPVGPGSFFSFVLSPVWKLFDMFIGVVQAFIFSLLTVLYFNFATDTEGH